MRSEGEAALAATLARRPVPASDFDGTLAPIVAKLANARVPVSVVRRLEQPSRISPLADITGRSVGDVSERLAFGPRFNVGNHGAEGTCSDASGDCPALLEPLREQLRMRSDELDATGVGVEDKRHSVALHYRPVRDRALAFGLITSLVANLGPGLKVFGGKLVVNVSAAHAPDKAQALADLVRRCEAHGAVYVGDDVNDEPVFERREPSWLTIRVGRDNASTGAMFVLEHPGEIAMLLERLLRLLHKPPD